uniref:CUE domain-containing protein n=1 Tax=Oryza punctata TaxID=4537 RepID=A0A0E0LDW1_ORYPU
MAATVSAASSRKRGFADILDDPFPLPLHHLAKRGRCSSSAASAAELGVSLEFDPIEVLQLIFPHEDPQLLKSFLEASGNVLDAAIRGFKHHLQSHTDTEITETVSGDTGNEVFSPKVESDLSAMNIPSNGSEWAELVVKEMSSALDLVDAKNRAFRILDLFEKSTAECTSPDEMRKMREEHKILKLMLGGLLEQNGVLKRAFLKQHTRLNDYEKKMSQERSQIIDAYEKEIKALQHRNYVLSYHLAQATQHGIISGHCNPDLVFSLQVCNRCKAEQRSMEQYLFLATVLILSLAFVKLRPRNNGENPPPGPWQLPVIGSLHHLTGALPHRALRDLARCHGELMLLRLGELPVVVASSPAAAREVMRTHDAAFATRPQTATLRALTRDGLGVAFAPQGEHWRCLRKLCVTELLGARRVRCLRGGREAEAAFLVASVASMSASTTTSEPVNVSSLVARYVTDAVVRAVVGDRISDRDAFLERLEEGVKVAAGFTLADVFPSSRLARALSGAARRAEAHSREMTRLMDGVIEEHCQRRAAAAAGWPDEEDEDLLDVLLRIQKDGGLQIHLDMGTIRVVIIDLFSAGSETTGTTLQWAMAELMRNPAALRKAQAEVRGVLAGQSHVTEDALPDLHYLHLVIKETLRLHVAVPLLLPRECQEPRRRVLGYDVPERAMVLVNAWAICRDAAVWGPDAEEFRPERFDGGGGAVDFRGTDFEFVPFGAGRRMCPGVAFAVAIMELGLASLLFHFDWELAGGAAPGELDMAEGLGITARRKNDLWLHATVRVPVPNTDTS